MSAGLWTRIAPGFPLAALQGTKTLPVWGKKSMDVSYIFGLPRTQDASHQWKFIVYSDSLLMEWSWWLLLFGVQFQAISIVAETRSFGSKFPAYKNTYWILHGYSGWFWNGWNRFSHQLMPWDSCLHLPQVQRRDAEQISWPIQVP